MDYSEERELLQLTRENNQMLKSLTGYTINHVQNANEENLNDFLMNVVANMLSTQFENRINK